MSTSSPLPGLGSPTTSSPWTFGSDPMAGWTPYGFEVPQGDPGEMRAAAAEMSQQATAFERASENVRGGAMAAIGGWRGQAEAAFSEFAGRVYAALSGNAEALDRGASMLSRLAAALEAAQQACRQAQQACAEAEQAATTAQTQADAHAADARNYSQQAADPTTHPAVATQLNSLAGQSERQAATAQSAADQANDELARAKAQGATAQREYELDAAGLASAISAAADAVSEVPIPAGGAPVPIRVTSADRSLATALLAIIDRRAGDEEDCINDPAAIGDAFGPIDPGTALELRRLQAAQIRTEERERESRKGDLIDALGGVVHGFTGAHLFGDAHTRLYTAESTVMGVASLIPIDPEGVVKDIAEGGERVAIDLGEHDAERVSTRATDLQARVPAGSQGRVTMAVGSGVDEGGEIRTVVGTSERNGYLRRGVTLQPGEELATGQTGHAELQILDYMKEHEITPVHVAAGRPICHGCSAAIDEAGARPTSVLKSGR